MADSNHPNSPTIDPGTRLGVIALIVSDLTRSTEFYVNRIGFALASVTESQAILGVQQADSSILPLLVLTQPGGVVPRPPRTIGLYHFAILVPSRLDLAQSLRHLAETRTRLQGAADHIVSEALYLDDPDGNGIEIYRDRPEGGWIWKEGEVKMDTLALDFGNLLDETGTESGPWLGLPPRTRIGHIHLHVPDLKEATRFYVETLGFEIVARLPGAVFVSAGHYHHHIGLNTWASRSRAPGHSVGLDYVEIRLPSAVGLSALTDRLARTNFRFDNEWDGILVNDPFGNRIALSSAI